MTSPAPALPAREAIRRAAIELFAEKGYAAASTREICQRAGITKPALYYHFENKERLYMGLLQEAAGESRRVSELAARRGTTARQKLVEVLSADFALTKREPALSLLFFRIAFAPRGETPRVDFLAHSLGWVRLLERIVAAGVEAGEWAGRAREIAEALAGMHVISVMGYLLLGEPEIGRRRATKMVDLLWKGCRAGAAQR